MANLVDLPSNGLHVIQGELTILLNSMRRPFKWSSQVYQEEEQDVLLKNLNQLKEQLNHVSSLTELDLMTVLNPFLEVIRSEDTSGPVTELALSAVFKFLSYGLIDVGHESTPAVVESLADAVTHARFVGTDSGSDEVVLMKILHVLRMLVLHPCGILLSNESICEIMQSCFRICFETRLSELLRKSAEHSLSEMVRLLYARLPQFPLQETKGSVNYKKLKMRTAAYDPSRNKKKSNRSPKPRPNTLQVQSNGGSKSSLTVETPNTPNSVGTPLEKGKMDSNDIAMAEPSSALIDKSGEGEIPQSPTTSQPIETESLPDVDNISLSGVSVTVSVAVKDETSSLTSNDIAAKDYINAQGVRFISQESLSGEDGSSSRGHVPYGLPCVRELFRFLISLINPLERQNTEAMIHIGLRLLTVAVETAADVIASIPSLLVLIQDETCRSLFALLNSERLSLLAAASRLCFLLFESARTRLKYQLETYIIKLMDIVAHEPPKVAYERRLVALEAMAQLCRIPGLVTELYLNYDCDCHTSDLFEDMIKHLSKNVSPVAGGIYTLHLLSLETLLIVVDSIEARCLSNQVADGNNESTDASQNCNGSTRLPPLARSSRLEGQADVPSREQLLSVRQKKKLLIAGAEHFNSKPAKGIQFLQENGLLSDPLDPTEVATLLRECSRLDKKQIGEYVSNRKNLNVLEAFVRSFDFRSIRIDEALRLYLEAFRLPGEAPLISLLMEQFADHWFKCNDQPFCNADAAFTLAYAVIMLNVDQHNNNVKRQNIPMTTDEFKRNLSKVNGGQDFDPVMLEDIYQAIRSEEIVMPAEQTGLVKDNYLWKVLLRRGATKEGCFLHAPNGLFDRDLFELTWTPTVSALGCLLDKASAEQGNDILQWVFQAFRKVSTVAADFSRIDVFDYVVQLLVKFTLLLPNGDHVPIQAFAFGQNRKAQMATSTVFQLVHRHGYNLQDGWKSLVDCIMQFYRMRILPDGLIEAEDLFDPNVKIRLVSDENTSTRSETSGLFSSLYSYIALSDGPSGGRASSADEQEAIRRAKTCVTECNIEHLISDSKFLQTNALQNLIKVLISSNDFTTSNTDEHVVIFVLELIIRVTVQNRDRVTCIWNPVRDHIYSLMMGAAASERFFVLERSIVGLLLLTGRLMRREDVAPIVLQSLRMLLLLKPQILSRVSRQVSYGLHELLKTGAANVHTTGDWRVLFTLLECVGAGAQPPSFRVGGELTPATSMDAISESETMTTEVGTSDRGYTSDSELYESNRANRTPLSSKPMVSLSGAQRGSSPELNVPPPALPAGGGGWIFVGRQGEIEHSKAKQTPGYEYNIVHNRKLLAHDPMAFVKSCESLAFLVRDVAHITPENFECAVQCIRTFVEASLNGGLAGRLQASATALQSQRSQRSDSFRRGKSNSFHASDPDEGENLELPSNYHQVPVQLLDLMHTLHTRAAQIYQWWASEGSEVDSEHQPSEDELKNKEEQQQLPGLSLWSRGWCPLLQGIARLCCDSRRQVRTTAITYLQRSLLVHDLQNLTASEWESCFNTVLFPLLTKLLEPHRSELPLTRAQMQADHSHWEETRIRAATLLSKVFLQHLGPLLQLPTFTALWLTLLDFMDKYMHAEHNDLLAEAVPEMMKNLLLVMETAGVFGSSSDNGSVPCALLATVANPQQAQQMQEQLWSLTCDRIDVFLPGLRQEVTRSKTPVARPQSLGGPSVSVQEEAGVLTTDSLENYTIVEKIKPEDEQDPINAATAETPPPQSIQNVQEDNETDTRIVVPTMNPVEDAPVEVSAKLPTVVPASLFSLWNVPEPSDAAAFFFRDVSPAASSASSVTESTQQEASRLDCHPLPIPLISDVGADITSVVPLPVLLQPPIDIQQNQPSQTEPTTLEEDEQQPARHVPLLLAGGEVTEQSSIPIPVMATILGEAENTDHHES